MKPHKHAELIKAWADGAEIQYLYDQNQGWQNCNQPTWYENFEYRIKPQPKPDVIQNWVVHPNGAFWYRETSDSNLKLTFDGKTGELKSAEVL